MSSYILSRSGKTPVSDNLKHIFEERHNKPCKVVKMYSRVNLAALQAGEEKELYLFYCLRSIDQPEGRSVLNYTDTIKALKEYGYTDRTARKHLKSGNGIYWRIHASRSGETVIILSSLEKVCRHLDVIPSKYDKPILLPVENLPSSRELQVKKALLYTTGAYKPLRDPQKVRPISKISLQDKTGVNVRTQTRYNAKIASQPFKGIGIISTNPYRREPGTYKLKHHTRVKFNDNGKPEEIHSLPNRYWSNYHYGNRGMLYRIALSLKAENQSSNKAIKANVETKSKKRYYSSFKTYCNAIIRHQTPDTDCYYPYKSNFTRMILGEIWN